MVGLKLILVSKRGPVVTINSWKGHLKHKENVRLVISDLLNWKLKAICGTTKSALYA